MAASEFSETQFVFGYLSEMYVNQQNFPHLYPAWQNFMFPSTVIEKNFPVDFFADYFTHSEYYQFKRSESFQKKRGRKEIKNGIPKSFLSYYRFKIYNRTSLSAKGQFEKLIELSYNFPGDLICYCAPCFHTETEFHYHFQNRSIISNSMLIDCSQFNNVKFKPPYFDINDGQDHFIVYKHGTTTGYICSEPKEIKLMNAISRTEKVIKQNKDLFKNTISILYNEFYIKDEIYSDNEKIITENTNEQFGIVGKYLLQVYNILWQPIFREK